MARHEVNQDHFAAERFDDFPADHLVMRIVSALYKDHWLDARNEFLRRIFIEHNDEIDGLERGKNLGARLYRLHGTAGALQAGDTGITVEAYNKSIACPARTS